ncbi:hypothetical protein PM082_010007 [Marasmius tenuissimus]|nr:hypothetical protein PM082_010007 [Marasmius tenuissimus]
MDGLLLDVEHEDVAALFVAKALTMDGIIYSHVKLGGYNGDEFILWLQALMPHMNPYPAPQSVLVVDNCRIHHVEGVEEVCEER